MTIVFHHANPYFERYTTMPVACQFEFGATCVTPVPEKEISLIRSLMGSCSSCIIKVSVGLGRKCPPAQAIVEFLRRETDAEANSGKSKSQVVCFNVSPVKKPETHAN